MYKNDLRISFQENLSEMNTFKVRKPCSLILVSANQLDSINESLILVSANQLDSMNEL